MPGPRIRWDYEKLNQIAQLFAGEADKARGTLNALKRQVEVLQGGDWVGEGAQAFYAEMDGAILPAYGRLVNALHESAQTTQKICALAKDAEDNAARLLSRLVAMSAVVPGMAAPGEAKPSSDGGGFWSGVGDFFGGIWDEGKDMVSGLYQAVRHPIDTAKGLWYGITHPSALWDGFKAPFVEAWESGHPWRAIGRGVMFVGSLLVGTKGADKALKAAKAARAARAAEIAETAAKAARAAEEAEALAKAAKAAEAAEAGAKAAREAEAAQAAAKSAKAAEAARVQRLAELANDPAHAGTVSAKTLREAEVGLNMEESGALRGPITRDPTGAAEFVDATGQKWDVKAFNSNFPAKKGGFLLERDVAKVEAEIAKGENVILDSKDLSADHIAQLRKAIDDKGLSGKVKWYP